MNLNDILSKLAATVRECAEETAPEPLLPAELDEAENTYFSRGGKLMRPALVLLCAEAFGGKHGAARAREAALSCEYFHLFTLLHDDVIDHDTLRRGRPTAHLLAAEHCGIESPEDAAEYGVATAILAGDALLGRAIHLISAHSKLRNELKIALINRLCGETLPLLAGGEALDTKLAYLNGAPDDQTLTYVYETKTGVLFEYALFAGALCGLDAVPSDELCHIIRDCARCIGVAFQLTDDYLGLTADEAVFGKTQLSDIREGKRTFFVTETLKRATDEECTFLLHVLGNADAAQAERLRARDLMLSYTSEEYQARIERARSQAERFFDAVPEGEAKAALGALFDAMIRRTF